jgi:hypothetical protein
MPEDMPFIRGPYILSPLFRPSESFFKSVLLYGIAFAITDLRFILLNSILWYIIWHVLTPISVWKFYDILYMMTRTPKFYYH